MVEPRVNFRHVEVDHLQAEILLGFEVVVEGTLRDLRRLEHFGDAHGVIALPQEQGHALLEQLLLGIDCHGL